MQEIIIYQNKDKNAQVEVRLDAETVWLSLNQLADLFSKDKSVISRHLNNIYKDGELEREATVAKNATVQTEAGRKVNRTIEYYNLDAIISVGYRVNSKQGTQFRIWATKILKEHLVKGFTLNEKRLQQAETRYRELQNAVKFITQTVHEKQLRTDESQGILKVLQQYSHALELLDKYDHQQLEIGTGTQENIQKLSYKEAIKQIKRWQEIQNTGKLFGNEKDESFKSSLETIYQTFDGEELYPSLEEKAAHLLYFVVKNHSFSDGNKRIAAGLFAYFLDLNNALFRADGRKILEDNALVALTLLIAESKPEEKDMMVKVIVNLLQ
ncbi:MAG: cytochrome C biogenesis protein CycH [Sphingobacteriales bacterium]|nr:MAG: cytochrome C biogenesis protein CycH [Sphingobacteriales bacterium]